MRPTGTIPRAPQFQLENDQLAQVLCQIQFSPVLRIRQDDAIIPFQEAVRQRYPRYAKQQGVALLLTPEGVQQQPAPQGQHRFDDSVGAFTAILSPEFVALETSSYADVDDFVGRVIELAGAVAEHYAPNEIQRVGLRFVNEIRMTAPDSQGEMREAIAPALLGPTGCMELDGVVARAQQILELAGDESRMLVRHGFHPQGGTTVMDPIAAQGPPRPEWAHPFYLLDIDAFAQRNLPYSVDGIEATLRDFNDDVRSFFAWSVQEDYRRGWLGQKEL